MPISTENSQINFSLPDLNWVHCILLTSTPLLALYGCLSVPLHQPTLIASIIYYFITGFGITGGYHRYWSHRTYEATAPFRLFLMLAGTGAVEGSIKWWARDHRAHHRYTDTPKDPYSAKRGLFYAHIGWMLLKKPKTGHGTVDVSNLNKDPLVTWQHKNYPLLAIFMAFILPTLICGTYWGDWWGGFFFMGVARLVFVHHSTFCINSLAHALGDHSYDDRLSPRDNFFTAILTLGEGYHNFHHEFPSDYRNGIKFYHYDPTKWVIWIASLFCFTYNLKQFPDNEIQKGKLQMQEKSIQCAKAKLSWGRDVNDLSTMTWSAYVEKTKNKVNKWIVIDKIVYDVQGFTAQHPGGPGFLHSAIGSEVTAAFNGGIYYHSNAARNLMAGMRIAKIDKVPANAVESEE